MNKKLAGIGLMCAFLVACGGSDDEATPEPSPAPVASPEGFWQGRASTGVDVALTVLENGETWGVYTSGGYILGALAGNTTSSGNQLTGSGLDFNLPTRTVARGTYDGTFNARESVSIRLSNGSTFTGQYSSTYDQPASLSALAGSFAGNAVTGTTAPQPISVTISPAGQITMPASLGCSGSGTATPRPTGKNIFNLWITFSGSTCSLGNGATVRGVAFYDASQRSLIALALNGAKTDGFIYSAQKQ